MLQGYEGTLLQGYEGTLLQGYEGTLLHGYEGSFLQEYDGTFLQGDEGVLYTVNSFFVCLNPEGKECTIICKYFKHLVVIYKSSFPVVELC